MKNSNFRNSETDRRLANVIRIGTVAEADYQKARVRVAFGTAVSDWLPWITFRAGGDHTWWAPEVGEQVVVLSPSGETSGGVVLGAMFSTNHPAPADRPTIHRTTYEDGAILEYDRENHILHAYIPGFEQREIDKDMSVQVHRDVFWNIDRDAFTNIDSNRTDTIGGNVSVDVGGDVQRTVGGKVVLDVQGEVIINSATRVTLSAPQLVFDGPITHGNSTHGGGAEFYGEIIHREGNFIQKDGDTVSQGVSLQHHVHPNIEEPVGGAS
ncbi:phage baseplate assembly protein V [Maridesulfovibrio salexigens]|uniref:Phage baseplate assembly protein V n=1 Tax=Maridesulfovibrio salexigens (strain ATCC 14822 / DSM 2638 / NCIMB 8403 / VKM B-1763) TaxID=526222 RepID=C6BVY0_MARSD|nr:phage baseplate assembly protein V [Maridesulfovibrio salexigens]ACS80183.1 phage baseplate assembly protein V [Maridesulfovibrio salexigens DSM 2638]